MRKSIKSMPKQKRYSGTGMRLTDCCGAVSTYSEGVLCCKRCFRSVPVGQGDGGEYRPDAMVKVKVEKLNDLVEGRDTGRIIYHTSTTGPCGNPMGAVLGRGFDVLSSLNDFIRRAKADGHQVEFGQLSYETVDRTTPKLGKRFQARYDITGEPIGLPQPTATGAVAVARREGFAIAKCSIEMYVEVAPQEWKKDVTCPAIAVR